MKTFSTIVRILLGLLILFSGVNKFGLWVEAPVMHDAMAWVINLSKIGGSFIIYVVAVVEILIGLSLLINKYVTIATLILLPLMVSILTFHIFLDLKGISIAILVFAMNVYILTINRDRLSKMIHSAE